MIGYNKRMPHVIIVFECSSQMHTTIVWSKQEWWFYRGGRVAQNLDGQSSGDPQCNTVSCKNLGSEASGNPSWHKCADDKANCVDSCLSRVLQFLHCAGQAPISRSIIMRSSEGSRMFAQLNPPFICLSTLLHPPYPWTFVSLVFRWQGTPCMPKSSVLRSVSPRLCAPSFLWCADSVRISQTKCFFPCSRKANTATCHLTRFGFSSLFKS